MPCYRCGVRQTDPSRGQSPWKRGVRRHSQILICPGCQDAADWTAELDRCSRCSSVHLVKRLGEVECRDCGTIVAPEGAGQAGLADDPAVRPVRPPRMSPARPGRAWTVSRASTPGPAWKVRAAVLICPRRSPGPWTGCSAGAWSARASSARPIRRAPRGRVRQGRVPGPAGRGRRLPGRGRGGVGRPGLSPGITRRPIQRRSGTGRPGRVPPGPMRPAWMPSGLVHLRGEPAG